LGWTLVLRMLTELELQTSILGDGDGRVTQEDFQSIVSQAATAAGVQLDFSSDWFRLYVDPKTEEINYPNFSQLLKVPLSLPLAPPAAPNIVGGDFLFRFRACSRSRSSRRSRSMIRKARGLSLPITLPRSSDLFRSTSSRNTSAATFPRWRTSFMVALSRRISPASTF